MAKFWARNPCSGNYIEGKIIEKRSSKYQELIVAESECFGRMLVLDGAIQFAEKDEAIYHEMLTYPSLILHEGKNIGIYGGGDGLAAKRILRFNKNVTVVDLDEEVIKITKEFFPNLVEDTFEKINLVINDALKYNPKEKFDILFVDLVDFVEDSPLYNEKAFMHYKNSIKDDGLIVMHGDIAVLPKLVEKGTAFFKHFLTYTAYVDSFQTLWSFAIFSNSKIDANKIQKSDIKGKFFSPQHFWIVDISKFPKTRKVADVCSVEF